MLDKEYDVHILRPRIAQTEEIGERANNLVLIDILNCQYLLGQAIQTLGQVSE